LTVNYYFVKFKAEQTACAVFNKTKEGFKMLDQIREKLPEDTCGLIKFFIDQQSERKRKIQINLGRQVPLPTGTKKQIRQTCEAIGWKVEDFRRCRKTRTQIIILRKTKRPTNPSN